MKNLSSYYFLLKRNNNKIEEFLFFCLALILFFMNMPDMISKGSHHFYLILAFEALFAISLALTGMFPVTGGLLYVLLYAIFSSFSILNKPTGMLYFGMVAVIVLWITRGWYLFAVFAYVISHIPASFTANTALQGYLRYVLFEFFCILVFGSISRVFVLKIAKFRERVERLCRMLDEQENRIRIQLASELHDYVSKDLAVISTIAQENQGTTIEAARRDSWSAVATAAQRAGVKLRMLISGTKTSFTPADIVEAIDQGSFMLRQRQIRLKQIYDKGDFTSLNDTQARLLVMLLREGLVNIFKYSPANSRAKLQITRNQQNSIFVLMENTIAPESKVGKTNSSEFGLRNLNYIFAKEGAILVKEDFETTWMLVAELPAEMAAR